MKAKHLILTAVAIGAASMFTACSLEPYEIPASEEYTRAFIKEFGLIDPQQDWNLAERAGITVTTDRPTNVRIYALIGGRYYLVGNYANVMGSRELKFDVPEGTKDLIVKGNGAKINTQVGESVTLTSGMSRDGATDAANITITELTDAKYKDNWLRMPEAGVLEYRGIAPEKCDNRYNDNIELNFLYVSNGPFIIHPVYWNTNSDNELGVYIYTDASDPQAIEVYNHDEETKVYIRRFKVFSRGTNKVLFYYPNYISGTPVYESSTYNGTTINYLDKESSLWDLVKGPTDIKKGLFDNIKTFAENNGIDIQLMSKGIKVDIPIGTKFGMYLKHGEAETADVFYSESGLNPDPFKDCDYSEKDPSEPNLKNNDLEEDQGGYGKTKNYKGDNPITRPWQAAHAATLTGTRGLIALMFEDWSDNTNSDMDLNDNVFVLFGANPTKETQGLPTVKPVEILTGSPYQWIIAAEDLGATDDFDFNDVVIGVEHVSGETTAQLTALAAGGTLPIEIIYNDEAIDCQGETQFHSWFVGNPSTTTMINTSSNNTQCKGKVTINVDKDFSLANFETGTTNYAPSPDADVKNMGGFKLRVERPDGTFDYITPPGTGAAPQMICVPGGWAWPKERRDIREGYKKFSDWVNDRTKNADWYKNKEYIAVASNLMFEPDYEKGTILVPGTGNAGGTTGIGTEFVVPTPTGNRDLTPLANSEGYIKVELDMSAVAVNNWESQLKKAWKYYKSYSINDKSNVGQFENNFKNALLQHYWNIVFRSLTSNEIYPSYNPLKGVTEWDVLSGTSYGNGKDCMLLEVVKFSDPAEYSEKVTMIAKVALIDDGTGGGSSPGTGGGGGTDPGTGGTTDPSTPTITYEELDVTFIEKMYNNDSYNLYKITPKSGNTLGVGDKVRIITTASSVNIEYGFSQTVPWLYKVQDHSDGIITIGDGYIDGLYVVDWNGGTISASKVLMPSTSAPKRNIRLKR